MLRLIIISIYILTLKKEDMKKEGFSATLTDAVKNIADFLDKPGAIYKALKAGGSILLGVGIFVFVLNSIVFLGDSNSEKINKETVSLTSSTPLRQTMFTWEERKLAEELFNKTKLLIEKGIALEWERKLYATQSFREVLSNPIYCVRKAVKLGEDVKRLISETDFLHSKFTLIKVAAIKLSSCMACDEDAMEWCGYAADNLRYLTDGSDLLF